MAKNLVNSDDVEVEVTGNNLQLVLSDEVNQKLNALGDYVIDSMAGTETNKSPSVNAVKNYVGSMDVYSTSEVKTNKIWIDNKPLYRKVFTGNISSSIEHGLTNVNFVNSYGYVISGTGNFMPLPSLRVAYPDYNIGYYVTNQYIVFEKGSSANGTATITLEYTKNS